MKPFERNFRSGDSKQGGGRSFGGGSEKRSTGSHRATCTECGSACEVPFKPSGARPVLCNNCFRRDGESEYRAPRFEEKQAGSFNKRNDSFEPRSNTFSRGNDRGSDQGSRFQGSDNGTQKQLDGINAKLDLILKMLRDLDE